MAVQPTPQALTFDCYGTLIDWEKGLEGSLLWILRGKADPPGLDVAIEAWNRHERALTSGKEGYRRYRDVLIDAMRLTFEDLEVAWHPRDGLRLVEDMGRWEPFDDVPAALEELRDLGYKLAILSNTDDDILARSVALLGVEPHVAVTAEQVRSYKPAEPHFREGLKRLGLEAGEVLHVSFSPYHDLEPAKRLGFRTFWVDRRGYGETEVDHDFQGRDLRALTALLRP